MSHKSSKNYVQPRSSRRTRSETLYLPVLIRNPLPNRGARSCKRWPEIRPVARLFVAFCSSWLWSQRASARGQALQKKSRNSAEVVPARFTNGTHAAAPVRARIVTPSCVAARSTCDSNGLSRAPALRTVINTITPPPHIFSRPVSSRSGHHDYQIRRYSTYSPLKKGPRIVAGPPRQPVLFEGLTK